MVLDLDPATTTIDLNAPSPTPSRITSLPTEPSRNDRHSSLGTLTPPRSSPSSSQNASPTKPKKKVNFCPWSSDPKAALSNSLPNFHTTAPSRHTPLRSNRKPLRSILKNSNALLIDRIPTPSDTAGQWSSSHLDYFSRNVGALTVPEMISSALQLLATPAGPTAMQLRLDGYQTLNGAFKTHSDLPDEEALRSSIPQLTHFISRDITTAPRDASGMNLITQALKLSITLMHAPALASSLDIDFQTTLLDNAIGILAQPVAVKAIANHFLYVLASQDFGSRVMLPAKVENLIDWIDSMHERISGNSAITSRLAIYSRLIHQCPTVMLAKVKTWLKHVFHGVLSSHKDVRARAIECGMSAGLAFGGKNPAVAKTVAEVFAAVSGDGGSYGDHFIARLGDMLSDKQHRPTVARIWAMVIVLMQSRKREITDWPIFRSLLLIMQRCMNASDVETKSEAMQAWNRLVHVSALDRASIDPRDRLTTLLKAPYLSAFGRSAASVQAREAQRISLHSYCNLLFYALQPSQSHERLDAMWALYVKPILPILLGAGGREAKFAVKILKTLAHGTNATWDADLANNEDPITPSDLPRLDPAWIRSRLEHFLDILEPFFGVCLWLESDTYSVASTPWNELNHALADAARHEVRTSFELKQTLAHLVNFFIRLWSRASQRADEARQDDTWIQHYCALLDTTIKILGPGRFSELNITEQSSSVVGPSMTHSHRISKHHAAPKAPLVYLIQLFFKRPSAVRSSAAYREAANDLILSVCRALPSHEARFALIRACVPKSMDADNTADHGITDCIVECAARTALDDDVGLQQRLDVHGALQEFMMTFEDLLDTNSSINIPAPGPLPQGTLVCLETLVLRLEASSGSMAVNDRLILPIVHCIAHCHARLPPITIMSYATFALTHFHWPASAGGNDSTVLLKSLFDVVSISCMHCQGGERRAEHMLFVSALTRWLSACNHSFVGIATQSMQSAIASMITNFGSHESNQFSEPYSESIIELWNVITDKLFSADADTLLLHTYASLLLAGFYSGHRAIVEITIGVWNVMLRRVESIQYPPELVAVLQRLRAHVRLTLPEFSDVLSVPQSVRIPYLDDPPADGHSELEDDSEPHHPDNEDADREGLPEASNLLTMDKHDIPPPVIHQGISPRRRSIKNFASALHPRHEESQVQFCDAQSSPLPSRGDRPQHLAEHQTEIPCPQQDEATRLFPEISSSPIPSFAKRKLRSSLADSTWIVAEQRFETPERYEKDQSSGDGADKSPTPKAAKTNSAGDTRKFRKNAKHHEPIFDALAAQEDTTVDDVMISTVGSVHADEEKVADVPDAESGDDTEDRECEDAVLQVRQEPESHDEDDSHTIEEVEADNKYGGDDEEMADVQTADITDDDDNVAQSRDRENAVTLALSEEQPGTHERDGSNTPETSKADRKSPHIDLEMKISRRLDAIGDNAQNMGLGTGDKDESFAQPESPPRMMTRSSSRRKQGRQCTDTQSAATENAGSNAEREEATQPPEPEIEAEPVPPLIQPDLVDSTGGVMTRSASKRKRDAEGAEGTPDTQIHSASNKRQRTRSPVKALFDRLWGSGPSEPAGSPSSIMQGPPQAVSQPEDTKIGPTTALNQRTYSSQPFDTSTISRTRSSGRKNKTRPGSFDDAVAAFATESPALRRSKRKATANSQVDGDPAVESPAPKRARRQSKATPISRRPPRQSLTAGADPTDSHSSRVMDAVVIPATELAPDIGTSEESDEIDSHRREVEDDRGQTSTDEIPESQLRPSQAPADGPEAPETAAEEAAGGQPSQGSQLTNMGRTLFGKLREVWNDFSRMALGFQEAAEYDNMLQDIRKEVMEAERRGRQQRN